MICKLFLLILFSAICLYGEDIGGDYVKIQLNDGRVLVGYYEAASQTLTMINPSRTLHTSMHIDARDIVSKEAAPIPAVVENKKKEVAANSEINTSSDMLGKFNDRILKETAQLKDLQDQVSRLNDSIINEEVDYSINWLSKNDVSAADLPLLPGNANPDQSLRYEKIQELNQLLMQFSYLKKSLPLNPQIKLENYDKQNYIRIFNFLNSRIYKIYLETRHK